MRKYKVQCRWCGHEWKVWEWLWILKFYIFGEFKHNKLCPVRYVQCPHCKKTSQYILAWHSPPDILNSNEREQHKRLEETWRRG